MRSVYLFLMLIGITLFAASCRDDNWVPIHFTMRNESRVGLEDLTIRAKGSKRPCGYLGPNVMMGFSFAKLPPDLKELTLLWKEAGSKRKAVIQVPPIPVESAEPPYVTLIYSGEEWSITVESEPPPPMPRH